MSVYGLKAPNTPSPAPPTRAQKPATKPPPANQAHPPKAPEKKPAYPVKATPGLGRGPAVTRLRRVPVHLTPEQVALAAAVKTMNERLKTAKPHDPSKPFDLEAKQAFYIAVVDALHRKTGGKMTGEAMGSAADALIEACLNDRKVRSPEVREANAANVRAASDYFREHTALDPLRTGTRVDPTTNPSSLVNLVDWIKPHTDEVANGYSVQRLGQKVLDRLSEATKDLKPNQAARLMNAFYNAYHEAGGKNFPLYASEASISELALRLDDAVPSDDVKKAKKLIELYRRETRELDERWEKAR